MELRVRRGTGQRGGAFVLPFPLTAVQIGIPVRISIYTAILMLANWKLLMHSEFKVSLSAALSFVSAVLAFVSAVLGILSAVLTFVSAVFMLISAIFSILSAIPKI